MSLAIRDLKLYTAAQSNSASFGIPDEPWMLEGLCAQTDPEMFFPDKGGATRPAKSVCNGGPDREPCPVKAQCLRYALEHGERYGVWGGMSERERRQLKVVRRCVKCGTRITAGRTSVYCAEHERRAAA